jgi:membrane protein
VVKTLGRSERARPPVTRLIRYAFVIGALKWVGRNRTSKDGSPAQRSTREPPKSGLQKLASVASTLKREISEDNLSIAAAGVAFYAFLSIFPGLAAAVSIYGLVSDPADIERQVAGLGGVIPQEALSLILEQMSAVASASGAALSIGTAVSILLAVWSATQGVQALMTAINISYRLKETRGFIQLKVRALALSFGVILFGLVSLAALLVVPALFAFFPLPPQVKTLISFLRWPLLFVAVAIVLAIVYRYAPDSGGAEHLGREGPPPSAPIGRIAPGAFAAGVLWIAGSALLSFYMANFGNYNETYGSLAAVVILMLWLYFSALVTLIGAKLNAILERHTEPAPEFIEPQFERPPAR